MSTSDSSDSTPSDDAVDAVRSRTAGADALARANPHPCDSRIEFDEQIHVYTVDGVVVPTSVTAFLKKAFDPDDKFDGPAVIRKWFEMWRRKGLDGEYGSLFSRYESGEWTKAKLEQSILESPVGDSRNPRNRDAPCV
jgi:hypothetical protein